MKEYALIVKEGEYYVARCADDCNYVERDLELLRKIVSSLGYFPVGPV